MSEKSPFEHQAIKPQEDDTVRIERIYGNIPQVTAAPTWTPKKFQDQFAFYASGSTYRLYVYDIENNAWRFCALS